MLLIASCDKPQSENGGANPEAEAKPEHSFSFLQASHRIEHTEPSYTQAVTETNKPTDDDRTIAYSSSDTTIATVDDKGLVTFNTEGGGTVTIKAEKKKKGKHVLRSAQYTLYITVKPKNKDALSAEIKRATKEHGNKVDLNYIDTSAITDMNDMFFKATAFNGDISKWDVSQVTVMSAMFFKATAFNGDISKWDVSKVTDMGSMFFKAAAFNGDISKWDVSQVTVMRWMFDGAAAFTQNLESWGKKLHATIANDMGYANYMFKNSGVAPVPSWCTRNCDHRPTR